MQQIQWHVRWPPSHPMIPPPLLWAALNNMFPEVVLKLFTCYDYHYYLMFAFTTISILIIVDDKIALGWLHTYLMIIVHFQKSVIISISISNIEIF